MKFHLVLTAALAVIEATQLASQPVSASPNAPTAVVSDFDCAGLNPWWGSSFQPGAALAGLLKERLENSNAVSLVDRQNLKDVLANVAVNGSSAIDPSTVTPFRAAGVRYLILGHIVQLDQTNGLGGKTGGFHLPIPVLNLTSTKYTIAVSLEIIDVSTTRLVQANDQQSATGASFAVNDQSAFSINDPSFQDSGLGKVLGAAADDLASKVESSVVDAPTPAPALSGRILGTDDGIIIDVGSGKGILPGMLFDAFRLKTLSGETVHVPVGKIRITAVSPDSATARLISGSVKAGDSVTSE
ncbi:MAG TPA: CsgG/HfaB family protein [Candidatus Baltobacteraceae bacterium]